MNQYFAEYNQCSVALCQCLSAICTHAFNSKVASIVRHQSVLKHTRQQLFSACFVLPSYTCMHIVRATLPSRLVTPLLMSPRTAHHIPVYAPTVLLSRRLPDELRLASHIIRLGWHAFNLYCHLPSHLWCHHVQGAAQQAAGLKQTVEQLQHQLHNSAAAATHAEQQLQEKVQQLQCSNAEKQNSILQLEQMCQATQMQLQVHASYKSAQMI